MAIARLNFLSFLCDIRKIETHKKAAMKILLLLLLLGASFSVMAQTTTDTVKTKETIVIKSDTIPQAPAERTYKVNMGEYQRDTTKLMPPNFMEPYQNKRVESKYNYENGKVTGGSTELKIGKKKKNNND